MSRPLSAALTRLQAGVEALEGQVLELRGDSMLPGGDEGCVPDLDRVLKAMSTIRADLVSLRSKAAWRAQYSRRRR